MNKTTRYAIAQNYPMRWESDPNASVFRLRLVAETFRYENGNVRTRRLWSTYSAKAAHYLHSEIARLGGNMAEPTPQALRERWQEAG
jgi:hypothetical protein